MSKPNDEARPVVTLLEPATAAERLGVSASGLRRLAPIYEEVHGELPRTGSGAEDKRARLWPEEAIERLRDARRLVELKRSKTILEALRALQAGVSVEDVELEPGGRHAGSDVATQQALQQLLKDVQMLPVLLQEVQTLRAEVAALRDADREKQLESPLEPQPERSHGLLVRLALWLETRLRKK